MAIAFCDEVEGPRRKVIQGSLSDVVAELHELDVLDLDIVREELSQRKSGKPAAVVAEIGNVADVIPCCRRFRR